MMTGRMESVRDIPEAQVGRRSAGVSVANVSKSYGAFKALDDVSLTVEPGEFVALLGPSGSGKSTLLMMIAGFETPSSGDLLVKGIRVNDQPAYKRGFGVVFQRYALFPHMTVSENVAYPLFRRGLRGKEVEAEVAKALDLVALGTLRNRLPAQLSGGQQQRVALARALVFKPPLLLMDEPLGALDRKLRQQLQLEIKQIHRQIGSTIIFVTHDQEEALSMADRVAVLEGGRLQQFGSPRDLYESPASAFVADFIGETSFLPVVLSPAGAEINAEIASLRIRRSIPVERVLTRSTSGRLAIRPENVQLRLSEDGPARVVESAYAGTTQVVLAEVGDVRLLSRSQMTPDRQLFHAGQRVEVDLDTTHAMVYPIE
jgi:putative spermidine/putrescine transport system ATP-binding protein